MEWGPKLMHETWRCLLSIIIDDKKQKKQKNKKSIIDAKLGSLLSVLEILQADEYVADGTADLVAFGVPFLANANLPELLAHGSALNAGGWQTNIWYSRKPEDDAKGYTDWHLVQPVVDAAKSVASNVETATSSLKETVL